MKRWKETGGKRQEERDRREETRREEDQKFNPQDK
jgi:hypothetical protein